MLVPTLEDSWYSRKTFGSQRVGSYWSGKAETLEGFSILKWVLKLNVLCNKEWHSFTLQTEIFNPPSIWTTNNVVMFRHRVALGGFLPNLYNIRTPWVQPEVVWQIQCIAVRYKWTNNYFLWISERGATNSYVGRLSSGRFLRNQLCDGATISVPSFPSIVTVGHNRVAFPVRVLGDCKT